MTKLALPRAGSRGQDHDHDRAGGRLDDYFCSILAPRARLTIVPARSRTGSACGRWQAKDLRAP
jgi:hypothetical protein